MPLLAAFNSIPKIAIAPLFVIWFGLGIESKILLAFLLALFPIFVNSVTGLGEIEADMLDLSTLAGGTRWRIFTKVRLMNAVPYITDALKVAFPLALVGSIVGEFIGGNRGIGYLILSGAVQHRYRRSSSRPCCRSPRSRPSASAPSCCSRACSSGGRRSASADESRRFLSLEFNRSMPCVESKMSSIVLKPGAVSLAQWRAVYRGASITLDPACAPLIERAAATVAAIVARGEPVYGINTGFGKLASVRIDDCRSGNACSATSCCRTPPVSASRHPLPVTRLMMALKLVSLAQGASGVKPATIALLEAFLAKGLIPVVPCQGSVGASGDLAPLAHMTATMIGVGEIVFGDGACPRARSAGASRARAAHARCQGGAGAAQRHAVLHRLRARRSVRGGEPVHDPRWSPARCPPTRRAARMRRSIRASTNCADIAARSKPRRRCAR